MPSSSRVWNAVGPAVAASLLGACAQTLPAGQGPGLPLEERPLLAVSAAAEQPVVADTASLKLSIEHVAGTAEEAARQVSTRVEAVQKSIQPLPGPASYAVEELSVDRVTLGGRGDDGDRTVGYSGRVEITVSQVPAADAEAIVRRALAHGASGASATFTRRACDEPLAALRLEAVRRAHARAAALVGSVRARLGSLYRLKEDEAACPVEKETPIGVRLRPASDGSRNPEPVQMQALEPLRNPTLRARVEVLLVYGLELSSTPPPGEAPGEVHVGMLRRGEVESAEVQARIELRVRGADADPSRASNQVSATMQRLITRLREAGLRDEELSAEGLRMGTRIAPLQPRSDAYKVRDYVAERRIEVTTERIDRLGGWLALAAQHGATGLSGPEYVLRDEERLVDSSLQKAIAAAMHDVDVLARAGGQQLRSVTQVRINDGWLSGDDPLQRFITEFGRYDGTGGYGRGAGAMQDDEVESLDPAFPVIEIRAPVLRASAAVGFALRNAER